MFGYWVLLSQVNKLSYFFYRKQGPNYVFVTYYFYYYYYTTSKIKSVQVDNWLVDERCYRYSHFSNQRIIQGEKNLYFF